MGKIYVQDLKKFDGKNIVFEGFIDKIKDLKYIQFVILRDNTGKVQVTIEKNEDNKELNEKVKELTVESTLKVRGIVNVTDNVKLGGLEIIPNEITTTSIAQELPINYKDEGTPRSLRHDYRHLDLRNNKNYKMFMIESEFENALRTYCLKNGFIELHSPKITAKAAESGSEVFKFKFFGQDAALSQSPQFYKQMAMASGFEKVFEIGPAFRAEKSDTNYHASEINMCDVELSWVDDISEVEQVEEEFIKYAIEIINSKYGNIIVDDFKSNLVDVDVPFLKLNFNEAKEILKSNYNYISEKQNDFDRKEELLLGKYALEKFKSDFVFIEGFPFESRAFYQQVDNNNDTKSYDLLFRGVEITTGALREHRYEKLYNQIKQKNIPAEDLEAYLELFKYGCPPHGGFGLGLSRVLMRILNIENIMDTNFIYRGSTRKLKL